MAKVLGESGRYVSEEATKRLHSMWTLVVVTMAAVGVLMGFMLRASFPWFTVSPLGGLLSSVVLLLLMWLVGSVAFRRLDKLEKKRETMRKGAAGEKSVGFTLNKLPDDFCVVNDVPTPTGNLDHVVIGPTGVFVIETKNWRGIVDADGKGELTCNGKVLKRAYVKQFVGRVMGTKERVQVLAPAVDPFFKALMVFTSAWVDAKFGTTSWVDCIRDDRLFSYIVDSKAGMKLSAEEVALIALAFAGLARMDSDFNAKAGPMRHGTTADSSSCVLGQGQVLKARALLTVAVCMVMMGFPERAKAQALAVRATIDLIGNGLYTDSYDSSDPAKSTNGAYDSARYSGDKGDVLVGPMGAPLGLVDSLGILGGSAQIYGHAHTGPGSQAAVLQIGPLGYCGAHADESTVSAGNVDPGWWVQDANFTFPDTTIPDTTGYLTPTGGVVTVSTVLPVTNTIATGTYTNTPGITTNTTVTTLSTRPSIGTYLGNITTNMQGSHIKDYTFNLITGGFTYPSYSTQTVYTTNSYAHILWGSNTSTNYYVASSLSGSNLIIGPNVVLAMPNGLAGTESWIFAPGANIIVYSGGTSAFVAGNSILNPNGNAGSFVVLCAPTVTSFSLAGNGAFTGCLIAPSANVKLSGAGNNNTDFCGCLMADSITMNGHFSFHFDESLRAAQLCLPEITAQPQSQRVVVGQNVEFSVSADGVASYQWQFNGTNLLDGTVSTLMLSNVQTGDAGSYSVVVANAFGSVTSIAATLTFQPPIIMIQPTNLAAVVNGTVTFSVSADGLPPLGYQWRVNGVDLPGQTNASITIAPVQTSDFADYTVLVSDANGSVLSTAASLTPAVSPQIASFGLNLVTATLGFPTEQGPTYVVEYKSSLGDASWHELTRVAGTGSPITITDNGLTDVTKFYRIHVQ